MISLEASYGEALRTLAKSEGHRSKMPLPTSDATTHPKYDEIAQLKLDGKTTREIGRIVGMSHGRVSQIMAGRR